MALLQRGINDCTGESHQTVVSSTIHERGDRLTSGSSHQYSMPSWSHKVQRDIATSKQLIPRNTASQRGIRSESTYFSSV